MSSTAVSYHSPMLVLDPALCNRIIADRHERTADRHDEVWEGVYILSPNPTNEHQRLIIELCMVLREVVRPVGGVVLPEVNVTDRADDWQYNFRCPDIAVMLPGCAAKDIDVAILGGPDFLVEIMSPYDKTMEKLDFYAGIGVRELLVVDRESKELELFALGNSKLQSTGKSMAENPVAVHSTVLPLSFQLRDGESPQIFVQRTDGIKDEWVI
jgi:Uma2 family endonuclease